MIAMCFDLSSVSIGVTFAQIDDTTLELVYGQTLAIIPEKPNPKHLGYAHVAPKTLTRGEKSYKALLYHHEAYITVTEAERRMADFKNQSHNILLRNIGEQCGRYLDKINPTVIAIEKNKSFNGILTTKLLAEIAGGIYFYCGARGITLYDWDESKIRAKIRHDLTDFNRYNDEGQMSVDTKWEIHCRLRTYFEKKAPGMFAFNKMTMDESDSLAVFYYLYNQKILKRR
jgi:hypothetical protein